MAIVIRADELLDACTLHDLLPSEAIASHRQALEQALHALASDVAAATGVTYLRASYDPGLYLAAIFRAGPSGETSDALQDQDPDGEWDATANDGEDD